MGALFFVAIVPAVLICCGRMAGLPLFIQCPRTHEILVSLAAIPTGIFFLAWSVTAQWRIGQGTPAPIAPTQKLIVEGPYKLCRNPVELGAILYYLGLGTLLDSLATGLACLAISFLFGSAYHKFVEEKELVLRFGEQYLDYKASTPFLIPRFWK